MGRKCHEVEAWFMCVGQFFFVDFLALAADPNFMWSKTEHPGISSSKDRGRQGQLCHEL